jgi:hypothetical protein
MVLTDQRETCYRPLARHVREYAPKIPDLHEAH